MEEQRLGEMLLSCRIYSPPPEAMALYKLFHKTRGNEDCPSIFLLTSYSRPAQLESWKLRGKREGGKKSTVA